MPCDLADKLLEAVATTTCTNTSDFCKLDLGEAAHKEFFRRTIAEVTWHVDLNFAALATELHPRGC